MLNPLPIELRPDFLERVNEAKDKGDVDWLSVLLASGTIIALIYLGCKILKDSSLDKVQFRTHNNDIQCCCLKQPSRCKFCSTEQ
jgi:hypothetical protein